VDLVHGLPEEEGAEGHREVGRHPHHLLLPPLRSLAPADLDSATAALRGGDGRDSSNRRPGIRFGLRENSVIVGRVGTGWSGPRFLFSETWPV
jgi:hypothetical protein